MPTADVEIRNPGPGVPSRIAAERIPVGLVGDYKPNVALMPDGELVLAAFRTNSYRVEPGQKVREDILLFRSGDGGRTWSSAEVLGRDQDLPGREPYLTILTDGTILMTCHHLAEEVRNTKGYTQNYIHRSADRGRTWQTTVVTSPTLDETELGTTRNVLEMPDGSLMIGVTPRGTRSLFLWISHDRGQTWAQKRPGRIEGLPADYPYGVLEESHLTRVSSGRLIAVARVDHRWFPIPGRELSDEEYDDLNRLSAANGWPPIRKCSHCGYRSLNDKHAYPCENDQLNHLKFFTSADGTVWQPGEDIGDYGMMYPSILRLGDGKVLLTFTVRHLSPPLGVRAVLGTETADGFSFDYRHNQFVLDDKTPIDRASGGGFGPTRRLADGTLITSYSYRGVDNDFHLEVVRWNLPASAVPPRRGG